MALHNSGLYRTALQLEKANVRECIPDVTAKEIKFTVAEVRLGTHHAVSCWILEEVLDLTCKGESRSRKEIQRLD